MNHWVIKGNDYNILLDSVPVQAPIHSSPSSLRSKAAERLGFGPHRFLPTAAPLATEFFKGLITCGFFVKQFEYHC